MEHEISENNSVNLKKYKVHYRKFPWALIIRIIVAFVSIAIIVVMLDYIDERRKNKQIPATEQDFELEIDIKD